MIPGGALPGDALNYVERAMDGEIADALTNGRAPSIVVTAPINGGTSSFLNRVHRNTSAEHRVSIVHFDTAFASGQSFTQVDLFKYLFRTINIPHHLYENHFLGVESMKQIFASWATEEWKDSGRIVMSVDGLNHLIENAEDATDPLNMINWLQALRNKAAIGEPPYDRLTIIVALTGKAWRAGYASAFATQAARFQLKKFDLPQTSKIFDSLQIDRSQYSDRKVGELFHGHPYLTQLCAWSIQKGATQREAVDEALNLDGAYGEHWERMKSEINSLMRATFRLKDVLGVAVAVADRPFFQPLKGSQEVIWSETKRHLHHFGLVDGPLHSPSICEFYRVAIGNES
jgi:hypothetical protein